MRSNGDWADGGAPDGKMAMISIPSQLWVEGSTLRAKDLLRTFAPDWTEGGEESAESLMLELSPGHDSAWGRSYKSWWWWLSFRLAGWAMGVGCFNCSLAVIRQERIRRAGKREALKKMVRRAQALERRRKKWRKGTANATNDSTRNRSSGSSATTPTALELEPPSGRTSVGSNAERRAGGGGKQRHSRWQDGGGRTSSLARWRAWWPRSTRWICGTDTSGMSASMALRSREIEQYTVAEVVSGIEGPSCLLFGTSILLGQVRKRDGEKREAGAAPVAAAHCRDSSY